MEKRKVTIGNGFPKDQVLLYFYQWSIVLNALEVYQHLLEHEVRSKTSFFHWIRCAYCRNCEQCPEIEDLESTIDSVKEIAGILEYLTKPV